jgi:4-carboxymuconolactone decarboxylase
MARAIEHYCAAVDSRLPYLRYDDLDADRRAVWDGVVGSRGADLVNSDGGLIGPFNAFVHAPGVGRRLSSLGRVVRFETSIERRLSEVAIITVGARWKAEFEWWAHARMAREHGVAGEVVDAIGRGEEPPFAREDERAVYTVARQITIQGQLDGDAYAVAQQLLGDAGLVELVSLCGYYTLVCYLLNAFTVPLPPGATPAWGDAPGAAGPAGRPGQEP